MSSVAITAPPPSPLSPAELSRIAQDLQIRKVQVEGVVQLLDEGHTVPFIARYRRERTHGLDEEIIRAIHNRIVQVRSLEDRKQTILKTIESQGKLNEELKTGLLAAESHRRLDDLYLPHKPKKKSIAAEAREKGLEPFALAVWANDSAVSNFAEVLPTLLNPEKQVNTTDDVLAGARTVIAEVVATTADARAAVRRLLWETAKIIVTRSEKLPEGKGLEYKDYFQFNEAVSKVPPHRILAVNRGERENALSIKLEFDAEAVRQAVITAITQLAEHPHREFLLTAVDEAVSRLLLPSLEREIRRELTDFALAHAIACFARNLRGLILQPPLAGKRVLAIDPGFRTGCNLAAIDEHGVLLEDAIVFPHTPKNQANEARKAIERLIRKHQISVVAIGNGTASRETEELISSLIGEFEARRNGTPIPAPAEPAVTELIAPVESELPPSTGTHELTVHEPAASVVPQVEDTPGDVITPVDPLTTGAETVAPTAVVEEHPETAETKSSSEPEPEYPPPPVDLAYVVVNEAGASDYGTSQIGREEFPSLDPALRGTISLGRRLQDPLSELVKIDPLHLGVGLYQHDVHGKNLKLTLESVIESCVNHVGVDLNNAAAPLLRYVAGLNQLVARDIVEYRNQHGPFRRREDLKSVPSVGPARFVQAAGFLKVTNGDEPLDTTWIHPESYELARSILNELGRSPDDLKDRDRLALVHESLNNANPDELARKHGVAVPTIYDLFDALARPCRDPREDLPPPVFRRVVLRLEDLQPGMELRGTVLNVVDFGAFVDIGLKDSGLVHISQLANRFIRNPHDVVRVGDAVVTWVMNVDSERHRVSLTMIKPGTERKPGERQSPEHRHEGGPRDSSGDQPPRNDRGPRRGRQRRGPRPQSTQPSEVHATSTQLQDPAAKQAAIAARNQRFERKPPKPKPLPNLTQEKREGKAYLNTLGELEAFFKARESTASQPPPD